MKTAKYSLWRVEIIFNLIKNFNNFNEKSKSEQRDFTRLQEQIILQSILNKFKYHHLHKFTLNSHFCRQNHFLSVYFKQS